MEGLHRADDYDQRGQQIFLGKAFLLYATRACATQGRGVRTRVMERNQQAHAKLTSQIQRLYRIYMDTVKKS